MTKPEDEDRHQGLEKPVVGRQRVLVGHQVVQVPEIFRLVNRVCQTGPARLVPVLLQVGLHREDGLQALAADRPNRQECVNVEACRK